MIDERNRLLGRAATLLVSCLQFPGGELPTSVLHNWDGHDALDSQGPKEQP
jgi:hypothetical protein